MIPLAVHRPRRVAGGFADLAPLAGSSCLEELNITRPRDVIAAHRAHVAAGAEILRTNTAGASPQRLDRYRMHDESFIVSYMAAEHASKVAQGRSVMGVARVEALAPLIGFLPLDRVEAASRTMASGLVGGGAELLLLEVAQCPARIAAAMDGARLGMAEAGRSVPVIVKLRHEVRLGRPESGDGTAGFARAAAVAAGAGAGGVALAPGNLAAPFADTLRGVAAAFAGPVFLDLAPTSPHWTEIRADAALARRAAWVSGAECASDGAVRPIAANDLGARPVAHLN
jgi:hypothetical protein